MVCLPVCVCVCVCVCRSTKIAEPIKMLFVVLSCVGPIATSLLRSNLVPWLKPHYSEDCVIPK